MEENQGDDFHVRPLSTLKIKEGDEPQKCSFCHGKTNPLFSAFDINRRTVDSSFKYVKCQDCNLISLSPEPMDMSAYYPSEYHLFPGTQRVSRRQERCEQYKVDMITKYMGKGDLLEIGPGVGFFAKLAKDHGFNVDVIEASRECCEFLSATIGVNAVNAIDPASVLKTNYKKYDCIAMWHVIEHVSKPWDLIEICAERLNRHGILVIATPSPESLQFRLFKEKWTHLDAPRHINLIPITLLRKWAEDCDLREIDATTADPGGLNWNQFGWQRSLMARSRHAMVRFLYQCIGKIIGLVMSSFEARGMNGTCYTATFTKQ